MSVAGLGVWMPSAEAQILDLFEPYPEKVDLLVVVAHPDDESTFGGLLPHYAICRGKRVAFVCLTSGEWGNGLPHHTNSEPPDYSYDDRDEPRFEKIDPEALYPSFYRESELSRVLAESGVRFAPVMPRFTDMNGRLTEPWGRPDGCFTLWGGRDRVVGYLVRQVRRFRPEVVVAMAYDGYNGNPQHLAASHGTIAACEAAGDPTRYPDGTARHDAWQVKKLYLAVSEGEEYDLVHRHSWELPCPRLAARTPPETPRTVAARANALHQSQLMKNECPASSDFVLRLTTVGPDRTSENDLFENVPAGRDRPGDAD